MKLKNDEQITKNRVKELEEQRKQLAEIEYNLLVSMHGDLDYQPDCEDSMIYQAEQNLAPHERELSSVSSQISEIDEELGPLKRSLFLSKNLIEINSNSTKNSFSDSLDRDGLADNIAQLINSQKENSNLSIGILGEWGSGKSTFLTLVENKLKDDSSIIKFDASKYDDQEQIWYSLLSSISTKYLTNKKMRFKRLKFIFRSLKEKKEWFLIYIPTVSALIFILLLSLLISTFQNFLFSQPIIKSILTFLSTTFGYLAYDSIKRSYISLKEYLTSDTDKISKQLQYPNYQQYLGTRENVRRDLTIFKDLIIQQSPKSKNIVIMIDELDRCSESTIINFFSSIEAFIDISGIIFVFSFNPKIVYPAVSKITIHPSENEIRKKKYGTEFIEKYINLFFTLPSTSTYNQYINVLLDGIIDNDSINDISSLINLISGIIETTPREIKKVLDLSLIYHSELLDLSYLEFSTILIVKYYFTNFEEVFKDLEQKRTIQFKNIPLHKFNYRNKENISKLLMEKTKELLAEINMYTLNRNLKQINKILEYA